MFTIFSLPKPFRGHIGRIQRNALATWTSLKAECQVILLGDEEGIEGAARDAGVDWIPQIKRNEFNTPLLNDAFRQASRNAKYENLCYVNADIMLLEDLPRAIQLLKFPNFLATGRRCNLDHPEPIETSIPGWSRRLRDRAARDGTLDGIRALDYFVFKKDSPLGILPDFAVGRPGWDNWMIYNARRLRQPVIDLTETVLIIHQLHDYNHVPQKRGPTWEGPEADLNRAAAGGERPSRFCLHEATHRLGRDGKLVEAQETLGGRLYQQIAFHPLLRWPLEVLGFPFLFLERSRRRKFKQSDSLARSVVAEEPPLK